MDIDLNTIGLLFIALFNVITAIIAWQSKRVSEANGLKLQKTQDNVTKIEIATNSMKDALVKATGEAAHAAGIVEGVAKAESKASDVAIGKLQGQELK